MTTQSLFPHELSPRKSVIITSPGIPALWQRVIALVAEWRRRAKLRRELAALTSLDLKDIGYPAHAEAEKAKPFWRA